jgi:hypothetical protein
MKGEKRTAMSDGCQYDEGGNRTYDAGEGDS